MPVRPALRLVTPMAAVLLCLACSGAPVASAGSSAPGSASAKAPSSSPSPSAARAPARPSWQPPPVNATADYQLGGPYAPKAGVGVVTRDRTVAPAPKAYGICYVNAFQTQAEEKAFWTGKHPQLLVRDRSGRPVEDENWPGEYLLDISTAGKRNQLAAIVGGWFAGCAKAGYRAVEPDNLDSWTRSKGRLTKAQTVAMAKLLISRAHSVGLAIAQKNAAELNGRALGFDFAVAEECQVYDECDVYTDAYGRHLIEIEYTDTPRKFYTAACRARGSTVSVLLRDRDVVPRGTKGYVYASC